MSLTSLFMDVARPRTASASPDDIEATLRQLWEGGHARWPEIELSPEAFTRHLAERLGDVEDPVAGLAVLEGADLYLACACCLGTAKAVELFEREYVIPVVGLLVRRGSRVPADDLRQMLSELVVVRPGDGVRPRIGSYSGRGPLVAWLRVTAARMLLRNSPAPVTAANDAQVLALATAAPDPELALVRLQCLDEFREAFRAALADLDERQRAVLRFHFLEGLSGKAMAGMYGVTRRTVHRWLEDGRTLLLEHTRARLAERMVAPPHELESMMHALHSELGSVVVRYLDEPKK